jgi:hypothetical protein
MAFYGSVTEERFVASSQNVLERAKQVSSQPATILGLLAGVLLLVQVYLWLSTKTVLYFGRSHAGVGEDVNPHPISESLSPA